MASRPAIHAFGPRSGIAVRDRDPDDGAAPRHGLLEQLWHPPVLARRQPVVLWGFRVHRRAPLLDGGRSAGLATQIPPDAWGLCSGHGCGTRDRRSQPPADARVVRAARTRHGSALAGRGSDVGRRGSPAERGSRADGDRCVRRGGPARCAGRRESGGDIPRPRAGCPRSGPCTDRHPGESVLLGCMDLGSGAEPLHRPSRGPVHSSIDGDGPGLSRLLGAPYGDARNDTGKRLRRCALARRVLDRGPRVSRLRNRNLRRRRVHAILAGAFRHVPASSCSATCDSIMDASAAVSRSAWGCAADRAGETARTHLASMPARGALDGAARGSTRLRIRTRDFGSDEVCHCPATRRWIPPPSNASSASAAWPRRTPLHRRPDRWQFPS